MKESQERLSTKTESKCQSLADRNGGNEMEGLTEMWRGKQHLFIELMSVKDRNPELAFKATSQIKRYS